MCATRSRTTLQHRWQAVTLQSLAIKVACINNWCFQTEISIFIACSSLVCLDSDTIPALNNPKMAADVTVDAGDEVCACTYPHVPERLQVQLHYFDLLPFSVTVNLKLSNQSYYGNTWVCVVTTLHLYVHVR